MAASAEQLDIYGQLTVDFLHEWLAATKPLASPFDFDPHHFAEGSGVLGCCNVSLADLVMLHILQRQVNPTLRVIDAHVLPKIRELQRGAGEIRKCLAFGDRKSTRLNSSHRCISYAVFCLK